MSVVAQLPRYDVQIFVGTQIGYTEDFHTIFEVDNICKEYCEEHKIAVTCSLTKFIYPGGEEQGAIVGLINYPRFPSSATEVTLHAYQLAYKLMDGLDQFRCSIFTPTDIILLENDCIDPELIDRT